MNYNIDSERKPHKSWMVSYSSSIQVELEFEKIMTLFFSQKDENPEYKEKTSFEKLGKKQQQQSLHVDIGLEQSPGCTAGRHPLVPPYHPYLPKNHWKKNSSSADIQVTHFTCWLRRVYKLIKLQTFSFFLAFSFGKESLGRLESLSGIATSDAKDTSLMHICFTPDSDTRSIFSSWM